MDLLLILLVVLAFGGIFLVWALSRAGVKEETVQLERQLGDMMRSQSEFAGQIKAMNELFAARQAEMIRVVNERLDGMGQRLNQSLSENARGTHENLAKLHERLAVIDRAQGNLTALSSQVTQLQSILANKQSRGAFGQMRMETIIMDGLPKGSYSFQANLSNGRRPDCLIFMPNDAPSLVIDAKFPLEAFNALRESGDVALQKQAEAQFRRDVEKHIKDISERYLIKGETQDTAFMFVPSESVFAAIHEQFEDLVQKAHRVRVVIVSPLLLMLSIQVVQAVLKDARMRDLAHVIQAEVAALRTDTHRLEERVGKLQTHFRQANQDVDQILISTGKVLSRSQKIETMELDERDEPQEEGKAAFPSSSTLASRAPEA